MAVKEYDIEAGTGDSPNSEMRQGWGAFPPPICDDPSLARLRVEGIWVNGLAAHNDLWVLYSVSFQPSWPETPRNTTISRRLSPSDADSGGMLCRCYRLPS